MSDDRFRDPPPAAQRRRSYYVEGDEIAEFLAWYEQRFGVQPKQAPEPMTTAPDPLPSVESQREDEP